MTLGRFKASLKAGTITSVRIPRLTAKPVPCARAQKQPLCRVQCANSCHKLRTTAQRPDPAAAELNPRSSRRQGARPGTGSTFGKNSIWLLSRLTREWFAVTRRTWWPQANSASYLWCADHVVAHSGASRRCAAVWLRRAASPAATGSDRWRLAVLFLAAATQFGDLDRGAISDRSRRSAELSGTRTRVQPSGSWLLGATSSESGVPQRPAAGYRFGVYEYVYEWDELEGRGRLLRADSAASDDRNAPPLTLPLTRAPTP